MMEEHDILHSLPQSSNNCFQFDFQYIITLYMISIYLYYVDLGTLEWKMQSLLESILERETFELLNQSIQFLINGKRNIGM